jgi:MGT family glycosyltransferase
MAHLWITTAPLYSHTDWGGLLKTAQTLQRREHDVTWVSQNSMAGAMAAAHIPFAPIRRAGWLYPPPPLPDADSMPPQEAVMLRYRRALDTWMSVELVSDATAALIELAGEMGKPDAILTDAFLPAAALAAEALDVPLIVGGWIAQRELNDDSLFPVQQSLAQESQERLHTLLSRFGLRGVNFAGGAAPSVLSPHLHISYFTSEWYLADAPTILPQTRFVGGVKATPTDDAPEWLNELPDDLPLAFITLGTVFTGDYGFYAWAAQAAAAAGLLPIIAVGWTPIPKNEKPKLLAALPCGSRLLNFVPLDQVLPRCKLVIHHGGMGTTHAAVLHGVLQIAVPHAADQRGNARRIAQASVGLNLSAHEVRHGALVEGAKALLNDPSLQANADQVAAQFAALGGVEVAADEIERVVTPAR